LLVKQEPTLLDHLSGGVLWGRLMALPPNEKPG